MSLRLKTPIGGLLDTANLFTITERTEALEEYKSARECTHKGHTEFLGTSWGDWRFPTHSSAIGNRLAN